MDNVYFGSLLELLSNEGKGVRDINPGEQKESKK